MVFRDYLDAAFDSQRMTQKAAAEKSGRDYKGLNQKIKNGSLRAEEFLDILDCIGIDVKLFDRNTGKEISPYVAGYGFPVKKMSSGVFYDTRRACALSNTFYSDGVNEYPEGKALELFVDPQGRYFLVERHEDGWAKITDVDASVAAAFIEKYGTIIDKRPTE